MVMNRPRALPPNCALPESACGLGSTHNVKSDVAGCSGKWLFRVKRSNALTERNISVLAAEADICAP